MSFKILLHPKAAQFLKKAHPSTRERIKACLKELEEAPEKKGEQLKPSTFWRLRIGDYRVIYDIDAHRRIVVILYAGHRRDVYDDFSRLI